MKLSHFSKLRRGLPRGKSRGLTLVELLVTIFIFSAILIIVSTTFVRGFMVGRVKSSSTKDINRDLNLATALISQKMTNANTKVTLSGSNTVYGFGKFNSDNILAIASTYLYSSTQCTFFGVKDQALYMKQVDDCSSSTVVPAVASLDQKITTGTTNITHFDLTGNNFLPSEKKLPYITVNITGEDPKTGAKVTLEETYSLNYLYDWLK